MVCVAVRNLIRVFTCSPSSGTVVVRFAREHSLEEEVVSVTWAGFNLCIGLGSRSYMFLDPVTGIVIQDVHVTSSGTVEGDIIDSARPDSEGEGNNDDERGDGDNGDNGNASLARVTHRENASMLISDDADDSESKPHRLPTVVLHDPQLVQGLDPSSRRVGGGGPSDDDDGSVDGRTGGGDSDDNDSITAHNTGEMLLSIHGPAQCKGSVWSVTEGVASAAVV